MDLINKSFYIYECNDKWVKDNNYLRKLELDDYCARKYRKFYRPSNYELKSIPIIDIYHEALQEKTYNVYLDDNKISQTIFKINEMRRKINKESIRKDDIDEELILLTFSPESLKLLKEKTKIDSYNKQHQLPYKNTQVKNFSIPLKKLYEIEFLFIHKGLNMRRISRMVNVKYHHIVKYLKRYNKLDFDKKNVLNENKNNKIDQNDLKEFYKIFDEIKDLRLQGKEIFMECKDRMKCCKNISYSTFYRFFLSSNRLSYKKEKIIANVKKPVKKGICRIISISLLINLIKNGARVLFFDETTFQMTNLVKKSWFWKGTQNTLNIDQPCKFVKLIMLTSFRKIVSFRIQTKSSNGNNIYNFLKDTLAEFTRGRDKSDETIIILDNAPKNRVKKIKNLVYRFNIRLFFTTPTSPQMNFIENIFFDYKRLIRNSEVRTRYV